MEAFIFKFTAEELRKVDSEILGFLVSSGHCCNELVAMMPYIIFEHTLDQANEVETALILARRYTIDRIIVSKIVEYDELCSRVFRDRIVASDDLFATFQEKYRIVGESIKAKRWARILRNKASFHYDAKFASDSLEKLESKLPLRMILGRISGLSYFEFSEEILSRPIFEEAGGGDIGQGMVAVNEFIVDAVKSIRDFHSEAVIAAFKRFGLITEREGSELREKYCGSPDANKIPLSMSTEFITGLKTRREQT